jgi:hypothetical protein
LADRNTEKTGVKLFGKPMTGHAYQSVILRVVGLMGPKLNNLQEWQPALQLGASAPGKDWQAHVLATAGLGKAA